MADYLFTTPVVEEAPAVGHRLFQFFKQNKALTVVREGSTYALGRWFTQDQLDAYDEYWLGGHEHIVSEATKDALIASGLGITSDNFIAQ